MLVPSRKAFPMDVDAEPLLLGGENHVMRKPWNEVRQSWPLCVPLMACLAGVDVEQPFSFTFP